MTVQQLEKIIILARATFRSLKICWFWRQKLSGEEKTREEKIRGILCLFRSVNMAIIPVLFVC
jgi:hypothetical protein